MPAAPRVFISYSHDSPEHCNKVQAFAKRLRHDDGIEVSIDQWVQLPPEGWPTWCEMQIRESDFVLLVCTETYLRRVERNETPGVGHGVMWEAHLIRQHLYDAGAANSKFVPILFSDGLDVHIPTPVRGASIYRIETDDGYISLYRLLTNQPLVPLPPLGQIKILQSDGSVSADSNDERFRSHQKALEKVKQLEVEGLLLPTDRASMNEVIRSRMLKEWGY